MATKLTDEERARNFGLLQAGLGVLANAYTPVGGSVLPGVATGLSHGLDSYQSSLDKLLARQQLKSNLELRKLKAKQQAILAEALARGDETTAKAAGAILAPEATVRGLYGSGRLTNNIPRVVKYSEGDKTISQIYSPEGTLIKETNAPRVNPLQELTAAISAGRLDQSGQALTLRALQEKRLADAAEKQASLAERKFKVSEQNAMLTPKDYTNIRSNLGQVAQIEAQIDKLRDLFYGPLDAAGRRSGGLQSNDIERLNPLSKQGRLYDRALDSMRENIQRMFRVPGLGNLNLQEFLQQQQKFPTRTRIYGDETAQQIEDLAKAVQANKAYFQDLIRSREQLDTSSAPTHTTAPTGGGSRLDEFLYGK